MHCSVPCMPVESKAGNRITWNHFHFVRLLIEINQTSSGLPCYDATMLVRNISEAKSELSALIESVQNGVEVIIAKAGKPVARLVAYHGASQPRTPGVSAG